jgi:hypothetical protein
MTSQEEAKFQYFHHVAAQLEENLQKPVIIDDLFKPSRFIMVSSQVASLSSEYTNSDIPLIRRILRDLRNDTQDFFKELFVLADTNLELVNDLMANLLITVINKLHDSDITVWVPAELGKRLVIHRLEQE